MAKTAASTSPLDRDGKIVNYVKRALRDNRKPSEIVHGLDVSYGIKTSKDSIRRFRERHAGDEPKTTKPTTKQAKKPSFQHSIIEIEGTKCITVFKPGHSPAVADDTHPNFAKMVEKAKAGDESVLDLFNVEQTIREHFESLSERVKVRNGHIYFDGDEIHDALTDHILRFLDEGGSEEDWQPLVRFLEKIHENPLEHSREHLHNWLASHKFSITAEGDFVGYKGVYAVTENDELPEAIGDAMYLSTTGGHAISDGIEILNGQIPQSVGSIVEMPRSEVVHDPSNPCSKGLHVGTFDFARSYGDVMLEVHVNPRDVGSVPYEGAEKLRCCRYLVADEITEPYEAAVVLG